MRLAKRRSKPDTAEKRRIDLVLQRSVETFVWRQQACWEQLKEQLAAVGIRLLSEKQWDIRQRQATAEIFQTRIMPLLTPFTVDAAHPFPYLASGQLAIALLQPHKPEMVVLPLPVSLPRLFSLPCDNGRAFVLLEDVVQRFLFARFPEEPGRQMTVFRLLRSAAETLLPGADDLCRATRELLSRPAQRFGHTAGDNRRQRTAAYAFARLCKNRSVKWNRRLSPAGSAFLPSAC